jgi:hypothetical protein
MPLFHQSLPFDLFRYSRKGPDVLIVGIIYPSNAPAGPDSTMMCLRDGKIFKWGLRLLGRADISLSRSGIVWMES